jgi:hypothetical protein
LENVSNCQLPVILKSGAALIEFIQNQLTISDCWCWETLIEQWSRENNFPIDGDRLLNAGHILRTGEYLYRRNDREWKDKCRDVVESRETAVRFVDTIAKAVTTEPKQGMASAWLELIRRRVSQSSGTTKQAIEKLMDWQGHCFRSSRDFSPELHAENSVLYGLWRLDADGLPIVPFPMYVGESKWTVWDRLKNHQKWWGRKIPIGVTFCAIAPESRLGVEIEAIELLLPFMNSKGGHKYVAHWPPAI